MKYIDFKENAWENELDYVYSYRYKQRTKFIQKDGYIESSTDATMPDGFDYITLMLKDKYKKGIKITTTTYFEKYGAPIILIANKLDFANNEFPLLNDYIEVVIWEKGINVWKHDVADGKDTWFLMDSKEFIVEKATPVTFSVKLEDGRLIANCGTQTLAVNTDLINDEVYVGIQACEGINRFYSLTIE